MAGRLLRAALRQARVGLGERALYARHCEKDLHEEGVQEHHAFVRHHAARHLVTQPWRLRLGYALESHTAHLAVIFLVVLDLVALFGELMLSQVCGVGREEGAGGELGGAGHARLLASTPSTQHGGILVERWEEGAGGELGGAGHARLLASTPSTQHGGTLVERWEEGLHIFSISILALLLLYQACLILSFGKAYFRKAWYLLDVSVISISLVLELTLPTDAAGFITVLLVWRVIRIIHGFVATEEEAHADHHALVSTLALAARKCTCGGLHAAVAEVASEGAARRGAFGREAGGEAVRVTAVDVQ